MRRCLAMMLAFALAACSGETPAPPATGPLLQATLVRSFSDAPAPAREAAFSPSGELLATSSTNGTVTFRRVPDFKPVRRIVHPGGVTSLAFSPDGRRLVTGGYDHDVRLWDVASGRLLRSLGGSGGTVWTVAISPDGQLIASAGEDKMVRLWSAADGRALRTLKGHSLNVWQLAFSPDGRQLASGGFDTIVMIWDPATGKLIRRLDGHRQAVVGLDYSRDGKWLASSGDDSSIRIWRTADGAPVRTIPNGNHAYKIAFSSDGRWLASGGRARGGIGTFWHQLTGLGGPTIATRLWRTGDGALVQGLEAADDIMSVAFSPDGQWLVVAGEDSTVEIWRLRLARN